MCLKGWEKTDWSDRSCRKASEHKKGNNLVESLPNVFMQEPKYEIDQLKATLKVTLEL